MINYTFYAYDRLGSHEADRLSIVLKLDYYTGEQVFDDYDIPEDYIPYYL